MGIGISIRTSYSVSNQNAHLNMNTHIRIHASAGVIAGASNRFSIHMHTSCKTEWIRLCRRPFLSTDCIRYCLLVTSVRCLEGGRYRNGARALFVFLLLDAI